jgi:hypothetical protein
MKTFHTLALMTHLWLAGQTFNRGEVAVPPAPRITIYSSKSCRPCYQLQADVKGKTAYDWHFIYTKHPAWCRETPYVVWQTSRGKVGYAGWDGFEDFEARYKHSMRKA